MRFTSKTFKRRISRKTKASKKRTRRLRRKQRGGSDLQLPPHLSLGNRPDAVDTTVLKEGGESTVGKVD